MWRRHETEFYIFSAVASQRRLKSHDMLWGKDPSCGLDVKRPTLMLLAIGAI